MIEFLSRFRRLFAVAALFSLCINVLLLAPTLYMLQVFDRVLTSRSDETLVMLTLGAAAALILMALLEVLRSRLLLAGGVALNNLLGPKALSRMLADGAQPAANPSLNALRDVATLRSFLTSTGVLALLDAPWLPVYLLIIFLFHPLLGAVALSGALLLLGLVFASERLTRKPLESLQADGRGTARFVESSLRNAEVVSALGMGANVRAHWLRRNESLIAHQIASSQAGGTINGFTKFVRQMLQVAMLGTGAWLVIDLNVSPGIMIAATVLLSRALGPVETAIAGWKSLVEARSAYARLRELLEQEDAQAQPMALPAPKGALALDRVMYAVHAGERPIVRGVSFALQPGESLGVIGPSGSGKSTLARLAIGAWKPVAGTVRLDGADICAWPREQLGRHVGYVPQDVELFAGTAAENIARLGTMDADAVVKAATAANAHEMILRLPQGYDTQIGEGGAILSGGQRQRIALARALFGDPQLVVLDEPNASLDSEGEDALMQALLGLKRRGATVLMITHRPALLANIDKVLVMREGVVELFGPRAEVIARVTRGNLPADTAVAGSIVPHLQQVSRS